MVGGCHFQRPRIDLRQLSNMRVLVVGGSGFIGHQVVNDLRSHGFTVMSMNRKIDNRNADHLCGDISTPSTYIPHLKRWKPEIVIYAAWWIGNGSWRFSTSDSFYAESTIEFAENCFREGIRVFIGFGSGAEYGNSMIPCVAGSSPMNPDTYYGRTQIDTSEKILVLSQKYKVKFNWMRVFQAYGVKEPSSRLIPSAIENLRQGIPITLKQPSLILDWITTRDIASATRFAIEHSLPNIIDIGTGIGTPVLEVVKKIGIILNVDQNLIEVIQNPEKLPVNALVVGKSSPLLHLGWKPQDSLESGLRWVIGA